MLPHVDDKQSFWWNPKIGLKFLRAITKRSIYIKCQCCSHNNTCLPIILQSSKYSIKWRHPSGLFLGRKWFGLWTHKSPTGNEWKDNQITYRGILSLLPSPEFQLCRFKIARDDVVKHTYIPPMDKWKPFTSSSTSAIGYQGVSVYHLEIQSSCKPPTSATTKSCHLSVDPIDRLGVMSWGRRVEDGGNITVFSCDCMCKPFASSPSFVWTLLLVCPFKFLNYIYIYYIILCWYGRRSSPPNKCRRQIQVIRSISG